MTTTDWWDRLYDQPEQPDQAPDSRMPDWRHGPVDLDTLTAEKPEDTAEQDQEQEPTKEEPQEDTSSAPHTQETEQARETEDRRRWLRPAPDYYPTPSAPTTRPALSPRTRAALYNATAAGTGWGMGLVPTLGQALDACGREASISAALLLGITACLAVAHMWDRNTRHWWPGLAWVARIPLASAITALALYTPASQL